MLVSRDKEKHLSEAGVKEKQRNGMALLHRMVDRCLIL